MIDPDADAIIAALKCGDLSTLSEKQKAALDALQTAFDQASEVMRSFFGHVIHMLEQGPIEITTTSDDRRKWLTITGDVIEDKGPIEF